MDIYIYIELEGQITVKDASVLELSLVVTANGRWHQENAVVMVGFDLPLDPNYSLPYSHQLRKSLVFFDNKQKQWSPPEESLPWAASTHPPQLSRAHSQGKADEGDTLHTSQATEPAATADCSLWLRSRTNIWYAHNLQVCTTINLTLILCNHWHSIFSPWTQPQETCNWCWEKGDQPNWAWAWCEKKFNQTDHRHLQGSKILSCAVSNISQKPHSM